MSVNCKTSHIPEVVKKRTIFTIFLLLRYGHIDFMYKALYQFGLPRGRKRQDRRIFIRYKRWKTENAVDQSGDETKECGKLMVSR